MSDKTNSSAPVSETCTKDGGTCGIGGYCFACHQFPIATQPPASPAPATAQDGQGGLTEDFRRSLYTLVTMFAAGETEKASDYWFSEIERAILARQSRLERKE